MCIFCGGTCGGVGDSLLPVAAVGIPFIIMKIRTGISSRKLKNQNKSNVDTHSISTGYNQSQSLHKHIEKT
jgi:hypothetical protein